MTTFRHTRRSLLALIAGVALLLGLAVGCSGDDATPLKIGVLLVNQETRTSSALDQVRAVELAVSHVNDAGGVMGRSVEIVEGDTADIENEVRRLIEDEGVTVILGPNSSAHALLVMPIATSAGILVVSPSASAPSLAELKDDDLFFRTVLSDVAQGPALAQLTRERGFDNIGLIHRDDAWGHGMAEAFQQSWTGGLRIVASPSDVYLDSYQELIDESAADGAQALVLLTFWNEAVIIVRESLESGKHSEFLFGDALRRGGLADGIDGATVPTVYGTASGPSATDPSSIAFDLAFTAEYGQATDAIYVKGTYDAAIAVMLAAESAQSRVGSDIRDQLRAIGSAPGEPTLAKADSIARALDIIRDGGSVDLDGASSSLDWDENGDLRRGYITIWRLNANDEIEDIATLPYER